MLSFSQKTISSKIKCSSLALHSAHNVNMTLLPAPSNSGIIFRRVDIEPGKNEVKANYKNVTTTNLGTTICNDFGTKISTIEHLMAAIWGCGIDNLIIENEVTVIELQFSYLDENKRLVEMKSIK
jgi:UDP-3-O-[3-hydroxymyristoyl] N-acetylglucosamine deacetylase